MTSPDTDALAETVARMEARFGTGEGARFMPAYAAAAARFEADLDDARDVLLSRGGALMLIQALLAERPAR
ncbi:hypothetical protein [Sinisalibacter aestuarii]|uniref:Uncharacterized protein n=1 Tax=Sinisalibacter aestuarii TaxID=2949426 RepID=A0ABQ5LUJ6_9RHOB|nr:hypothetical protein [Sinisalibacter aestuarii]GKY88554.1 hypothetical protein STA1M1_24230 [Sinisalibacter aestuarii]